MSLPVVQPARKIRRSRSTRWRVAVLVLVHVAVAVHITHWLISGRTVTPVEPSEAAALARSGVVNTGLVFFAVTILLTALFGRFFCGWACHLVALQDLARSLFERFGRRPAPLRSRLLRWVPAAAFLYAFVWPAAVRWRQGGAGPIRTEFTTSEFWATFPGWIVGALTFVVCGALAVYFLGAKGFCTYACPYGAVFGAAERLSPLRIRVTDACEGCGHCTAVCTSNVRVHEEVRDFGMVVDSGCMKCLDCVSVCPNDALYYGFGRLPVATKGAPRGRTMDRFPLTWAEEAVVGLGFVAGFLTFRGLYGYVPFLMALGVGGILAYGCLQTYRLATRPNVSFKAWSLKRAGRLRRAGAAFLAVMALVVAFWGHSAFVRYLIGRGDRAMAAAGRWHRAVFDVAAPRPQPAQAERSALTTARDAYGTVERAGLFPTLGAPARRAEAAYLLGRDDEARRDAERSIRRGEFTGPMHQLLGRMAFDAGDLSGAATQFEKAIEADPYDERPHASLGVALARAGDLDGAREVFERALRDFGDAARLEYDLGLVEAWSGRLEPAADRFARAVALEPDHLAARENLAGTLAALGRLGESAEHYRAAIALSPEDPVTRVLYGRVLQGLGRVEEAREQARRALALSPAMPEAVALAGALEEGPES